MKREANCSLEEPYKWKINLFQKQITENSKFLYCYNVIWLHHSETSSTIMATMNKGSKMMNLERLYNKDNLEITMGISKSSDIFKDYSGDTFGMWVIEHKQFSQGGYIQYD